MSTGSDTMMPRTSRCCTRVDSLTFLLSQPHLASNKLKSGSQGCHEYSLSSLVSKTGTERGQASLPHPKVLPLCFQT